MNEDFKFTLNLWEGDIQEQLPLCSFTNDYKEIEDAGAGDSVYIIKNKSLKIYKVIYSPTPITNGTDCYIICNNFTYDGITIGEHSKDIMGIKSVGVVKDGVAYVYPSINDSDMIYEDLRGLKFETGIGLFESFKKGREMAKEYFKRG
ncbi:hypothetical protein [Zunongwangia atlantica]|nr:hypothetical protein [Zunongwangia atlantica]